MKIKRQRYIYVARDRVITTYTGFLGETDTSEYNRSYYEMSLDESGAFCAGSNDIEVSSKPFFGIKLKPGEQKRVPILVDKAEMVK